MSAANKSSSLEPPVRADARRNYELLLTAARQAFLEHGSAASLEEIARRAGVGIGTLYRRFPNRQALLEAVYIDEVESMCAGAAKLASMPPMEALTGWLDDFVEFGMTKSAIAKELIDNLGKESQFFHDCKATILSTMTLLLARAQESGDVRRDVDAMDVLRLVGSITHHSQAEPKQAQRLVGIVLDGLRAKP
jgi:AcrR family transcriptional regulator